MHNAYNQVPGMFLQVVMFLGLVVVPQAAFPLPDGKRLYAPCAVCHQPRAWGSPDGSIPNLAGQHERYLEKQIASFGTGKRTGRAMELVTAHSAVRDPENVKALANYLAALDANPNPIQGSGDDLRIGQEIYTRSCASCHGADGLGERGTLVPRIAGQHYPYLRRRIEGAAVLHGNLAPPDVAAALGDMRPEQKDALADYMSRLGTSVARHTVSGSPP